MSGLRQRPFQSHHRLVELDPATDGHRPGIPVVRVVGVILVRLDAPEDWKDVPQVHPETPRPVQTSKSWGIGRSPLHHVDRGAAPHDLASQRLKYASVKVPRGR